MGCGVVFAIAQQAREQPTQIAVQQQTSGHSATTRTVIVIANWACTFLIALISWTTTLTICLIVFSVVAVRIHECHSGHYFNEMLKHF